MVVTQPLRIRPGLSPPRDPPPAAAHKARQRRRHLRGAQARLCPPRELRRCFDRSVRGSGSPGKATTQPTKTGGRRPREAPSAEHFFAFATATKGRRGVRDSCRQRGGSALDKRTSERQAIDGLVQGFEAVQGLICRNQACVVADGDLRAAAPGPGCPSEFDGEG